MHLARLGAVLLLLAGCAEVSADPVPTPTSNEPPVSVAAPEPEPTIVVAPVVEPDPERCRDGGLFVRLTPELWVCGRAGGGPALVTLFPVTNVELVRLIMGPYSSMFERTIIPRETGHRWQPNAITQTPWCNRAGPGMGPCTSTVNGSGCINWTQLCSKQKEAAALGYTWHEAEYALPGLLIARGLVDYYVARGLDPYTPWRCSECSLR